MDVGDQDTGVGKGPRAKNPSWAPVGRRTKTWAVVALVGGVLLALNSLDSFEAANSAGTVVGGAIDLLLGLAIVVSAAAVGRRGDVRQVTFLGLLGPAAFGWQYLALGPVEIAVLGGRLGLIDVSTAVSALTALGGSVGVCLSTYAYRDATWASVGDTEGRPWLLLIMGASITSVIALFLPYATYEGTAKYFSYWVDAWIYFTGITDTVILVLMLSCGTLAALSLARPRLPYRWALACVGVVTFAYVFTPSEFGSETPAGQAVSLDVGFWLILIGALVVSTGAISSWRRSVTADRRRSRNAGLPL